MRLIDADELIDFFFSETSGTEETIRDLIIQHNLDYANDVDEDEVMDFAKELLKNVCNVIDTEPTAYDIDKVVEEIGVSWKCGSTDSTDCPVKYCWDCDESVISTKKAIEIVKQGLKEQNK